MTRSAVVLRAGVVAALAIPAWAPAAQAQTKGSGCVECHQAMEGGTRGPAALFPDDVHAARGLTCADCHGGDPASMDPEAAMDPARGFLGHIRREEIPALCARCHANPEYMRRFNPNLPTDQYAKYLTSQHGKRFAAHDADVPVCTSCHGVHGILQARNPSSPVYATNIPGTCATCHADASVMDRHGLPVNQHWEYSRSVHGQALLFRGDRAAPHCASCHGSHEAARPGTLAVGNVCAQCHALSRDLFVNSPHKAAHEALGLPECEVCHGNHLIARPTDEMLGTGPEALCVSCHEPESAGFRTAQAMRGAIERLKTRVQDANALIEQADGLGMDVADAEFELHEAGAKLTQSRAYVHAFSMDKMDPIVEEGLAHADEAAGQGEQAVEEFHFRRKGFWVTLVILGLLILGLVLRIRELDRPDGSRGERS
ncbi:MAG TPA: cytochrome c3 family protein [bacterium]